MPTRSRRRLYLGVGVIGLAMAAGAAVSVNADPPEAPPAQETLPPAVAPQVVPEQTEITVFLKDGQRFSGLLVDQTAEHLIIRIEGIQTRFSTASVDRIRIMPPIMDRYEEMRTAMGDDASQIVKLADWLRARERLELALYEVERAISLAPQSIEAQQLRTLIVKQIELRERARPEDRPLPDTSADPSPHPISELQLNFPLLTPEQISLMKVYEVDLSRNPRIVIRRETIQKLLEQYRAHPLIPVPKEGRDAIYRWPPRQVLDLMFRVQARNLYHEVQIVDQPESIRRFRDDVHRTWLINSCATNQCHGGEEAGRLMLSNRRPNAEASIYTNLLIMERYRLSDGTPLVNYENPAASPLLQMALPRGDSMFPHPAVPMGSSGVDGWRPVFRSTDDRRFKQAVDWINAMYRPRPELPVEYTPPGSSQPTAPPPEPVPR